MHVLTADNMGGWPALDLLYEDVARRKRVGLLPVGREGSQILQHVAPLWSQWLIHIEDLREVQERLEQRLDHRER